MNRTPQSTPSSGVTARVRFARIRAHGYEAQVSLDGEIVDVWVPRTVVDSVRANLYGYADLVAAGDGRTLAPEAAVQVVAVLCARAGWALEGELRDFDDLTERPTERYSDVPTGTLDPPGALVELATADPPEGGGARWVLALLAVGAFTAGLAAAALIGAAPWR